MKKKTVKKPNTYVVRSGAHISQKDVDIIAPYLHENLFPNGNFDKEIIVTDAQDPRSPLHKHFDWNNKTASHSWRLHQAQKLITSFYIRTPEGYELPSVVSIVVEDVGRTYMATPKAIEQPDLCKQVIQEAINGLIAWKKRYKAFINVPQIAALINIDNIEQAEKGKITWQEGEKKKSRLKNKSTSKTTPKLKQKKVRKTKNLKGE